MSKNPVDRMSALLSVSKPKTTTIKARRVRREGKGKVSCTFTLSPEMYLRLQEIKLARGTSLQGLLEEAVDVWLAQISETEFRGR